MSLAGTLPAPGARAVVAMFVAALSCGIVSACSNAVDPRERGELDNIWRANVIPKTNPAELVRNFRSNCVAKIAALVDLPKALFRQDYIEVKASGRFRAFVTDSKKPFVAFKDEEKTRHCLVAATARTGQTRAIDRMMAEQYPGARPIDPAKSDLSADAAWLLPQTVPTIVYVKTQGLVTATPRLVLGIIQTSAAKLTGDRS